MIDRWADTYLKHDRGGPVSQGHSYTEEQKTDEEKTASDKD